MTGEYQYGRSLFLGAGVRRDYQEAVKYYNLSAEHGYAPARYSLAECYYYGLRDGEERIIKQDYQEAVKWLEQAAEDNYAPALSLLGVCCENGYGLDRNRTRAAELFARAAEQGDATGEYFCGVYALTGRTGERDPEKAVEWFRKAAAQGSVRAQLCLSICYYEGIGVTENRAEADRWMSLAELREYPADLAESVSRLFDIYR